MENAKQKAIEVAYGEYWEEVKDFVNENGFIKFSDVDPNKLGIKEQYESTHHDLPEPLWRLDGVDLIVNNNNWISIHSEEDLPKESIDCFILQNGNVEIGKYIKHYQKWFAPGCYYSDTHKNLGITHYQPIIKPLKPIY